jgi:DNA-binding transcriptional ArsR family regulator
MAETPAGERDSARKQGERGDGDAPGGDESRGDAPEEAESGSDVEYPDPAEPLTLDEALSVVGEETRARILVELGEAVRGDGLTPAALSFSELMERVGAADSGRFNYHLDKLVGTFVLKTEEGYQLRPPGHFVYRAVVAGRLTGDVDVDPFEVGDCPDCGTALVAEYPISHCFYVRCRECETFEHVVSLPAAGFDDRSPREALATAVRKRHHEVALMRHGVCHGCGAAVELGLDPDGSETWNAIYDHDVYATLSCGVCNVGGFGHPALVALVSPPVVAFFDDHGRDAFAAVPWEPPLSTAKAATTVGDGQDRVTVPFELDGDRLTVTLDDDLSVIDTERA